MEKLAQISLVTIAVVRCFLPANGQAAAWPQLQNNPQRHGYSPEKAGLPLQNAWVRGFSPDRLFPQTQPMIAEGRLFIGTEMGAFYGIEA